MGDVSIATGEEFVGDSTLALLSDPNTKLERPFVLVDALPLLNPFRNEFPRFPFAFALVF